MSFYAWFIVERGVNGDMESLVAKLVFVDDGVWGIGLEIKVLNSAQEWRKGWSDSIVNRAIWQGKLYDKSCVVERIM